MTKVLFKVRCFLASLFCLTLWLALGLAYGQFRELVDTANKFSTLYSQDRCAGALPFAGKAVGPGEKELGPDHLATATFISNLAALYVFQGRHTEAEPLFKRALTIWEMALGPDHPEVGLVLANRATPYEAQGKYSIAEPLKRQLLGIRENA
jgi:tetratricopeptide (TPR) repeat protein